MKCLVENVMDRLLRDRLVLIVDDMPLNLLILEQILQVAGATVIKAANGKEALTLLETKPVELILTDLQMPEMNGWEMATHIRQSNKWYRQLPIIATTSETDEADRQRCFATGMNDVLHKPVDPAVAYRSIASVLTDKQKEQGNVASQNDSAAAFDLCYLKGVTNGDKESMQLFIDNLKENGPLLLIQAIDSVHKSSWAKVAAHLHKLKGLTALFGMHAINTTLLSTEQEAKKEQPATRQVLENLNDISKRLTHSIQQISRLTQAD